MDNPQEQTEQKPELPPPNNHNLKTEGNYTLEIEDQVFTLHYLSGFRYMKIYSNIQNRDTSELYRDLILGALIDPILTKEEVEDMKYSIFSRLGVEIISHQEASTKN